MAQSTASRIAFSHSAPFFGDCRRQGSGQSNVAPSARSSLHCSRFLSGQSSSFRQSALSRQGASLKQSVNSTKTLRQVGARATAAVKEPAVGERASSSENGKDKERVMIIGAERSSCPLLATLEYLDPFAVNQYKAQHCLRTENDCMHGCWVNCYFPRCSARLYKCSIHFLFFHMEGLVKHVYFDHDFTVSVSYSVHWPWSFDCSNQEKFLMANMLSLAGGDGYCGWATALHLSARGHEVGFCLGSEYSTF
jgi:hypothetical protein